MLQFLQFQGNFYIAVKFLTSFPLPQGRVDTSLNPGIGNKIVNKEIDLRSKYLVK